MAKPLKILDEAVTEGAEAWNWYRVRSERAGRRFQQALEDAIQKLQADPDRWPTYLRGTKYVALKRFPYIVVYRELDEDLQIIAIAHSHRRRGYWKKRMT